MFASVRPHRQQPTRLPHPWDSPGKNTGVGCHFLLQCMKVKSEGEVVQSGPTLSYLMDCSLPGSSVHGIFQARIREWGAIAFSTVDSICFLFWKHKPLILSRGLGKQVILFPICPSANKAEFLWAAAVEFSPCEHGPCC